jgi:hypothetical protein
MEAGGVGKFPNVIFKLNIDWFDGIDSNVAKLYLMFENNFQRATLNFFNF